MNFLPENNNNNNNNNHNNNNNLKVSVHNKIKQNIIKTTSNNVKILCAVITTPNNLNVKAKTVMDTWGKRCDKLLFMSSPENGMYFFTYCLFTIKIILIFWTIMIVF